MKNAVKIMFAALALAVLVSACASNPHADAGKRFIADNKPEQAVAELQLALKAEPGNIEARAGLERARSQLVARYMIEGENARIAGQFDAAEAAFLHALEVIPRFPRAVQALKQIETGRGQAQLIAKATMFLKMDNPAAAESQLRTVLAQNPAQPEARKLMKDIEQRRSEASAASSVNPGLAKPVTLEFRDTPIRSVFEILARTSGINFIFDKDVKPDIKVTIFVRNSSVDDVMKLVLVTNQLEKKRLNDNSILIYPNTAPKLKDYQELVTRSFFLSNADVKQAQALVKQIVKSKDIFIDEKLNLLVVKDTAEAVRLAEKLLESLDMAEPEVMLEVEVLEVSRNKLLDLGPQFPEQIGYGLLSNSGTATTVYDASGKLVTSTPPTGSALAPGVVNLRNHPSGLTTYVANPGILLNLKDQDGSSRLLANPRIRVKNRNKAKILIGDKIPVFTTTSTANVGVAASVTYLDVGLKLEVEPNVSLDNEVGMKVGLEVSSIGKEVQGPAGSLAYQIGTRSADTNLRLRDGETQVLAGLINDEERSSASHLPGIGDIPLVGRLFSATRDASSKTEIVLLITPHIVRNLAWPDAVESSIPSGTDSAVGALPLTFNSSGSVSLKSSGGGADAEPAGRRRLPPQPVAPEDAPAEAVVPEQENKAP